MTCNAGSEPGQRDGMLRAATGRIVQELGSGADTPWGVENSEDGAKRSEIRSG